MIGRVLQGLLIASGAWLLVAGARAMSKQRRPPIPGPCPKTDHRPSFLGDRDHFRITCCRGKDIRPQWLLQGFGRYQCFLFFDSWHQAMEQATFRLEGLGAAPRDLVQLTR